MMRKVGVKIFPNGNFAQKIKLPKKKNIVRLVQVLNGKKKSITRHITVRNIRRFADTPVRRHADTPVRRHAVSPPRRFVIVIDPGHGGKEHGTHSPKGIPEKVFNLQIGKLLFAKLHTGMPWYPRRNVYLTRSTDKFISLKDRINFAKKKKCNLFISIHHNALPDNEDPLKHKGVGVYYTHDFVKPLAKSLLESISKESGLKKYGIFKRNFAVTRPDFYAGVLIECGFLIHPVEGEEITKPQMQKKIVDGIIKSKSFLNSRKPL